MPTSRTTIVFKYELPVYAAELIRVGGVPAAVMICASVGCVLALLHVIKYCKVIDDSPGGATSE
jgi:hypothetical protein